MNEYVVASFTHGGFSDWASEPMTLDEAQEFVADPPGCWTPRQQDELVIFRLEEVQP